MSRQPPEPNHETLRHELSRLRAEKRLTYDQLAELTGLSRTVLINLEPATPEARSTPGTG